MINTHQDSVGFFYLFPCQVLFTSVQQGELPPTPVCQIKQNKSGNFESSSTVKIDYDEVT